MIIYQNIYHSLFLSEESTEFTPDLTESLTESLSKEKDTATPEDERNEKAKNKINDIYKKKGVLLFKHFFKNGI